MPVINYKWDNAQPPTRFQMDVANTGRVPGFAYLRALSPDGSSASGLVTGEDKAIPAGGVGWFLQLTPLDLGSLSKDGVVTRVTLELQAGSTLGATVAVDTFEFDIDRRSATPDVQNVRAVGIPRLV